MIDDDYVKIINSTDPTPEQILDAAKAGEIDLYIWAEEGFDPKDISLTAKAGEIDLYIWAEEGFDPNDLTPEQILDAAKAGEIDLYTGAKEGVGPNDSRTKQILLAVKAGKIDLSAWTKEGVGPISRYSSKPDYYKLDFANHDPFRQHFFKGLQGRGHAVPLLVLVNAPVKKEDLFIKRIDIATLREKLKEAEEKQRLLEKKPLKLRAALAAQEKFPHGEEERIKEFLSNFPRHQKEKPLTPTTKRTIIMMIKKGEVNIAAQVWEELYSDGHDQKPVGGHINHIKDHLQKRHDKITKTAAQRIAETVNPTPDGGAPKTPTAKQP